MWCHERNRSQRTASRTLVALALATAGSAAATEPASPTLKISGEASFSVEARASGSAFELRATLSDEVGRPLPNAEVRARANGSGATATLQRCGDVRGAAGGGELLLTTDKAGRLCVTVIGIAAGSVELSYRDARGYLERANRVVRLPEGVSSSFEVGFDPPITTLVLDQPLQELGLVARAQNGAAAPPGAELVLSLATDGSERELARVALDSLGEVHRLTLVSASFGQPGPVRLLARLRGRGGEELAQAAIPVLLRATVHLQADPALRAGVEPGASLQIRASSVLGAAPSGVIEARSRGLSVAAARVKQGVGTLTLPSAAGGQLGSSLTLEYVGGGAGWLSGPPLELRVLAAGPGYARYVLWTVAAVLAALAVVLGWRRPPRARPIQAETAPRPRASVEVLETFGVGGGYRGFVRDAHDGVVISPALVTFIGSGPNRPVLAQARTSTDGAFHIESSSFPADTQVEVTAPFHATLTAALPVPGVIELSLVSRRRALLDRLVRWAERRGKPWTRGFGEPTPTHIADVAANEAEPEVERWARGLEHLAFGPTPPDAASEQAAGVADDPKVRLD